MSVSIGVMIDDLQRRREDKRLVEKTLEEIKKDIDTQEYALLQDMEKQGIDKATGKLASVSVSETIKPSVEDWDMFYAFINKHKYFHLLERRPSVTGCRELFETKGKIPGVVPFKKRALNIRTLS